MVTKLCTVLVVEDDADTREALVEALRGPGFDLREAADGESAREHLDPAPDVVLLDFRLPGTDTQTLLAEFQARGSRVIVLTGDSSARLLGVARTAKLLRKPIGLDELEEAVKEACAA